MIPEHKIRPLLGVLFFLYVFINCNACLIAVITSFLTDLLLIFDAIPNSDCNLEEDSHMSVSPDR